MIWKIKRSKIMPRLITTHGAMNLKTSKMVKVPYSSFDHRLLDPSRAVGSHVFASLLQI